MATWRNARSLDKFRAELDAVCPDRSRESDGTIGDQAHAARTSDHNPNTAGVVTGNDFTDDDAHGADMRKVLAYLLRVKDRRIKYLIHEAHIYSSYPTGVHPAWAQRPYTGLNGHFHHLHVSVSADPALYDNAAPWGIADALEEDPLAALTRDDITAAFTAAAPAIAEQIAARLLGWDTIPDSRAVVAGKTGTDATVTLRSVLSADLETGRQVREFLAAQKLTTPPA